MDDELDRLKPAGLPADMQRWNKVQIDSKTTSKPALNSRSR